MSEEIRERIDLYEELKKMHICRFCLSQSKLTSIFVKPGNANVNLAPLTVQVMACASIEIFSNDGMPTLICHECRALFEHSYRFKQMCKRADTLLRQYPLTGKIPQPLERPKVPQVSLNRRPTTSTFPQPVKKILNAAPAVASTEAPMRFTFKTEPNQEEIHLLDKDDHDEEMLMEDVQNIIANAVNEDIVFAKPSNSSSNNNNSPPKLLNKSSKRYVSIDLDKEAEPQFSKPKMQVNQKGHIEMVTAIVQSNDKQENNGANNEEAVKAEPVATDNFPCPFCERCFPLLQLRDIHLTRHNRERNFQCPYEDCDKSFFSKYDLQKHEVRHTGERPFKCQACDKSFTRLTLLHRHERIHTDIPKFLCMYCEKPFISKDELETHIIRHEKNRPFKCNECGKSFAFKQGLERHEVVHSAVLPYPCQYCDQSFTTPSKLSRHLTQHAGTRPFPCKYCKKSYMLSHHLTRHLRSHKQDMSTENQCTDCKKNFSSREALIYHTAVHSTTNLTCTLCQVKFKTAEDVAEHIKLHVENEAYACEFCDLLFLSSDELLLHYDETHKVEVEQYKYNSNDVAAITAPVKAKANAPPTKRPTQQKKQTLTIDDGVSKKVIINLKERVDDELNAVFNDDNDGDDENVVAAINDIISYNDLDNVYDVVDKPAKKSPEKPTIINQIVFKAANATNHSQQKPQQQNKSNENLDSPTNSAKTRKVVARDGKLQIVDQHGNDNNSNVRRKIATKPAVDIKIEKEEETHQKPIKKMTLAEAKAVVKEKNAKSVTTEQTKQIQPASRGAMNTRRSGAGSTGGASTSTVAASSTPPTTSKSPPQQKPTKVKQIRMTKAMADELAKQGRIKIKDGNMILTKSNK